MHTLGDKIQFQRKRLQMSQEALAGLLGVSRQSVSKWESSASIPELDKIMQLGELFEVSLDYLLINTIDQHSYKNTRPSNSSARKPILFYSGLLAVLLGIVTALIPLYLLLQTVPVKVTLEQMRPVLLILLKRYFSQTHILLLFCAAAVLFLAGILLLIFYNKRRSISK